jgi:hypothetical protein
MDKEEFRTSDDNIEALALAAGDVWKIVGENLKKTLEELDITKEMEIKYPAMVKKYKEKRNCTDEGKPETK